MYLVQCLTQRKNTIKGNCLFFFFLAALGLHCSAWAFSSCGKRGLLFVAVRGLLIAVASLVAEHGLQACRFSSCSSRALECRLSSCDARAQLLRGMWDLLEPVFPALAGGFLTTAPPGKSPKENCFYHCLYWFLFCSLELYNTNQHKLVLHVGALCIIENSYCLSLILVFLSIFEAKYSH